jgi:hypothetical protein
MKREYLGWAVAVAVVLLVCALGAMQRLDDAGRYQVVFGDWTVIGDQGETSKQGTVVRVDTATGQTALLSFSLKSGEYRWLRVVDPR